ncbi:MAG: IS1634 family transposase [Emergencia sp.]|nr:IS1634 family transposase [Emergencia sp.]
MFLIKEKRKHGTYLCIVQSYRDPDTKKTKKRRIKNIGYLEDLQKEYDDPIAYFQQVAKEMSEEYSIKKTPIPLALDPTKKLESEDNMVKNFGYAALSAVYYELKLDDFFRGRQRALDIHYSLNSVMKLLVYGRILFPGSEKQIYRKKDRFFDKMEFSLDDLYSSFPYLHRYKSQLQKWIHERICENYGRDTRKLYYYVTNHYFELDEQELQHASKEQRHDPTLQMGLFVDTNHLPVSYELFQRTPGDIPLLTPVFKKAREDYGVERVIVVVDNGVNSAHHLYRIAAGGNGYIVSQSIRSAEKEIKDYVLNPEGYVPLGNERRMKSRLCTRKIRITTAEGKKKTVCLKEKQIIFHDAVYARWAIAERENVLMKAKDLIASPGRYNKSSAYGVSNYIKNIEYDNKTGEILQDKQSQSLALDEERLREEESFDGYYMIYTSELEMPDAEVIYNYSDIWEIQDAFTFVNESFLAKPDFVLRSDHAPAHFSTCFIALTLTRILQMKTQWKYPLHRIVKSFKKCTCVRIEDNYYIQTYYDSVLATIGDSTGIDFEKKYRPLCQIKEQLKKNKSVENTLSGNKASC